MWQTLVTCNTCVLSLNASFWLLQYLLREVLQLCSCTLALSSRELPTGSDIISHNVEEHHNTPLSNSVILPLLCLEHLNTLLYTNKNKLLN